MKKIKNFGLIFGCLCAACAGILDVISEHMVDKRLSNLESKVEKLESDEDEDDE